MFLERLMGLIVVFLHRRFLEHPVHAFHLTIRPGMVGFGQPMDNAILLADAIEDMMKRVSIALPVGELDTIIGQHGVERVGYSGDGVAQELGGDHLVGSCMQFGIGKFACTVNGNKQGELPFFRADLSDIDMEVADWV
jgi:hypothetical protein